MRNSQGGVYNSIRGLVPAMQAVIVTDKPITQNQWYDGWTGTAVAAGAGSVKFNVRVICLSLEQATAQETIEVRIIVDNLDETESQDCVAATNYFINGYDDPDVAYFFIIENTAGRSNSRSFLFEGRKVQIMYRKTSNAGANDTRFKVVYATY